MEPERGLINNTLDCNQLQSVQESNIIRASLQELMAQC